MTCCGQREKAVDARAEQKWDYINLNDFKSTTCLTPLSYGILYVTLVISVAVYGVDIFTAANLLFFDRWSGQVQPVIPFHVSRWIFSGCILLSWVLLIYRWTRAVRAMRSGVVAASYLDPLAVMIQSIRMGASGRGWKRFLVFAELTKGRKGAEYVALFTYFSFEAWLRIVFAEGPRQVINALTLYSVMQANLVPVGDHKATDGHSPGTQFFVNIKILANHNKEQAAILFGMLFTLIIWVVSALGLAIAALFYILFLWHYIPNADDGLSGFCRRKVDSRLQRIVGVKIEKALAQGHKARLTDEAKALKLGEVSVQLTKQPTLPVLDDGTKKSIEPQLSRQTTQATLPLYVSRQPSQASIQSGSRFNGEFTFAHLPPFQDRPVPSFKATNSSLADSSTIYSSNTPLAAKAAEMDYTLPSYAQYPNIPNSSYSDVSNSSGSGIDLTKNLQVTKGLQHARSHSELSHGQSSQNSVQNRRADNQGRIERSYKKTCVAAQDATLIAASQSYNHDNLRAFTPGPYEAYQTETREYERQPQKPAISTTRSYPGDRYVAFDPRTHSRNEQSLTTVVSTASCSPPMRNFTMPTTSYRSISQLARPVILPRRSDTAPILQFNSHHPAMSSSHSVSGGRVLQREAMPARAATASSGAARLNGNQRSLPQHS